VQPAHFGYPRTFRSGNFTCLVASCTEEAPDQSNLEATAWYSLRSLNISNGADHDEPIWRLRRNAPGGGQGGRKDKPHMMHC
jgi:hypothetical protein